MDLVLGLQKHLLLPVLTGADGFVDQAGSLQLSRADLPLGDLFPVNHTGNETGTQAYQANNDSNNNRRYHKLAAHLLLIKIGAEGVAFVFPYSV